MQQKNKCTCESINLDTKHSQVIQNAREGPLIKSEKILLKSGPYTYVHIT